MTDRLDRLTREARAHLGTKESREVEWERIEGALFDRIEAERSEERNRFVPARGRWSGALVGAAAAAAAVAFAVHGSKQSVDMSAVRGADEGAGRVLAVEGEGQAFVDGRPLVAGTVLRLGDVLEARGVDVTVERPGKLTFRVEGGSRVTVTRTDGSLVLALAEGAVEAQVVPVPSGEAFAVDVAGSRVAVHGTHLRVARGAEDRVAVDLNEGVVAVGNAPRIGSVMGALVTAPAHAEFGAADVGGTLRVTHDHADVRPPVALGHAVQSPAIAAHPAEAEPEPVAAARAPAPPAHLAASPAAHSEPRVAQVASPSAPQEAPERAVTAAVRSCMAERPSAENVTVVVSTTLHLDLNDDGTVRAARFEPPVAPDVNGCAAAAIYKARFSHGGTATLPVDFSN
jgi:hypothetical protein